VTVPVGQLVALDEAALLGHVDADHLLDAGPELDARVTAAEAHGAEDDAAVAGRDLEGGVLDLLGLLAEDRAQQTLLGRWILLALEAGVTHEDVPWAHLGADTHDAVLVEVTQRSL